MNRYFYTMFISVTVTVFSILLLEKSCANKEINNVVTKQIQEEVKVGYKPTVTLIPSNNNINSRTNTTKSVDGRLNKSDGISVVDTTTNASADRTELDIRNSTDVSFEPITTVSGDDIAIQQLPTRTDNPVLWSRNDGTIKFKWYWVSFAPGINYQTNGTKAGLGIDIRWLYVGDLGLQGGIGLYRGQKATPQFSLGYNLRRTKILSNTDLIVGIDLDKTLFGGIRCELGNYYRK